MVARHLSLEVVPQAAFDATGKLDGLRFIRRTDIAARLERLAMPAEVGPKHRFPHFTHIFDGGYASAYYSYAWSEALDADAFEAFVASGDIFDAALADRFRTEILGKGDSRESMASFCAFRGREPDPMALMRARPSFEGLSIPPASVRAADWLLCLVRGFRAHQYWRGHSYALQ